MIASCRAAGKEQFTRAEGVDVGAVRSEGRDGAGVGTWWRSSRWGFGGVTHGKDANGGERSDGELGSVLLSIAREKMGYCWGYCWLCRERSLVVGFKVGEEEEDG